MRIMLTRDSVCAADDMTAPNETAFEIAHPKSIEELVTGVCGRIELPSIAGGRATWCLSSRIPLAVIAQEWSSSRMVWGATTLPIPKDSHIIELHASYFAQLDPEVVFEVLGRLRLAR